MLVAMLLSLLFIVLDVLTVTNVLKIARVEGIVSDSYGRSILLLF